MSMSVNAGPTEVLVLSSILDYKKSTVEDALINVKKTIISIYK